jgi:hypothetical protein
MRPRTLRPLGTALAAFVLDLALAGLDLYDRITAKRRSPLDDG